MINDIYAIALEYDNNLELPFVNVSDIPPSEYTELGIKGTDDITLTRINIDGRECFTHVSIVGCFLTSFLEYQRLKNEREMRWTHLKMN